MKTFISPVASSMVAPALTDMSRDLGVSNTVESQMMLSIFILAYAFGPLLLGPLSEVYGRVPVLQLANLFFLVFNLVCGFAQTSAQMLVFRFLAGLGGSAPLSIGGGILADCFTAEQRGKAIAIYSLAPLIGPAAGPVAGGFIAGNISWRWVFWIVSIADAVVQISGLFFLQETWAPKLLEAKARRLRKETGNSALYAEMVSPLSSCEHTLVADYVTLVSRATSSSEAGDESQASISLAFHATNHYRLGAIHGISLVSIKRSMLLQGNLLTSNFSTVASCIWSSPHSQVCSHLQTTTDSPCP